MNFQHILADIFDRHAERSFDSIEAEREAIAKAQLGDTQATIDLIYAYAPALRRASGQYRVAGGAGTTYVEDVRMAAVEGLIEAIYAFDLEGPHRRLAATIIGEVNDSVGTSVLGPIGFSVPSRTLTRFYGILRAAEGDVTEAVRLAPAYQMKSETFLAVLDAVRNVGTLDETHGSADSASGDDDGYGRSDASPLWDGQQADAEDRILVEAAFRAVDDLEGDVVRLAYGFSDFDPVPDSEVAHRMGLSRQKAQRTRTSAIVKMRSALGVA